MSAFTEALRRYRTAETDAERDEAAKLLQRWAIDPEYDPDRKRVLVP